MRFLGKNFAWSAKLKHGRDSTPFKGIRQLKNLSTIKTVFLAYSLLIVLTFKISWFICSIIAFLIFLPVILILRCKDNGNQITQHEVKIEEDNDVAFDVEIPSCNRDNQIVIIYFFRNRLIFSASSDFQSHKKPEQDNNDLVCNLADRLN